MNIITHEKVNLQPIILREQENSPIAHDENPQLENHFSCNGYCFENKNLYQLFEKKIIDQFGEVCLEGIDQLKLPSLQKEELGRLEEILQETSLLSHSVIPADYIEADLDTLPQLVSKYIRKNKIRGGFSRELVGGVIRYIFGLSYYKRAFETIGMGSLFNDIPNYIIQEFDNLPLDVDQKIYVPKFSSDQLSELDQEIKNYFVKKIQSKNYYQTPFSICRESNFFNNYKYIKDDQAEFLIVSFGTPFSQVVDNSIIRHLSVPFLFGNDAISLNVPGYISYETYDLIPESKCHNGWQSLVSFMTKTVFSPEPEKVNRLGWLRLISHFTKGYTTLQPNLEKILQNTYLRDAKDLYPAFDIIKVIKSHHGSNNYSSAILFLCNAFVYLSEIYDNSYLTQVAKEVLCKIEASSIEKNPLICWLKDVLKSGILPFKVIFSYLSLIGNLKPDHKIDNFEILERNLSGSKGLQFRFNTGENLQTMLIPKNMEEAWKSILEFSSHSVTSAQISLINKLWNILGNGFNLHVFNEQEIVGILPSTINFEFFEKNLVQTNQTTTEIGLIYQLLSVLKEGNLDFIIKIYKLSPKLSSFSKNFQNQYISLVYQILKKITGNEYTFPAVQEKESTIEFAIAYVGMQTNNVWIQKQLLLDLYKKSNVTKEELLKFDPIFEKSERNLLTLISIYRSILSENKVISNVDVDRFGELVSVIHADFAIESMDACYKYALELLQVFRSMKNKDKSLIDASLAMHMHELMLIFKNYSELDLKQLHCLFIDLNFIQHLTKNITRSTRSFLKDLLEMIMNSNLPKYSNYREEIIHYFEEHRVIQDIQPLLEQDKELQAKKIIEGQRHHDQICGQYKNAILDLIQKGSLEDSLKQIKSYTEFLKETDPQMLHDSFNLFIDKFFSSKIEDNNKKLEFIVNFYSLAQSYEEHYFFESKYFLKVISLLNCRKYSIDVKNLVSKLLINLTEVNDLKLVKNLDLCQVINKNMDHLINKEFFYNFLNHFLTLFKNESLKIDDEWLSLFFHLTGKFQEKDSFNMLLFIDALLKNNDIRKIINFNDLFKSINSWENNAFLILKQVCNKKNSHSLYLQLVNKLPITESFLLKDEILYKFHHRSIFLALKQMKTENLDNVIEVFLKDLVFDEKCWELFSAALEDCQDISLKLTLIDRYFDFEKTHRIEGQLINEETATNIFRCVLSLEGRNLHKYFLRIRELMTLYETFGKGEYITTFFECLLLRFADESLDDPSALNYAKELCEFLCENLNEVSSAFRPVIRLLICHKFLNATSKSTQEIGLLILENVYKSEVDPKSSRFIEVTNAIILTLISKFIKHENYLEYLNILSSFVIRHKNKKLNFLSLFYFNPDYYAQIVMIRQDYPYIIKNIEYINHTGIEKEQIEIVKKVIVVLKELELYEVIENDLLGIKFEQSVLNSLKLHYINSRLVSITNLKNMLCMDTFEVFIEYCSKYFSEMDILDDSLVFENLFNALLFRYGSAQAFDRFLYCTQNAINSFFGLDLTLKTCFEEYVNDLVYVCKRKRFCLSRILTDLTISLLKFSTTDQELQYPLFLMRFIALKNVMLLRGVVKPVKVLIKEFIYAGIKTLHQDYASLYIQSLGTLSKNFDNEIIILLSLLNNHQTFNPECVVNNKQEFQTSLENILIKLERFDEFFAFDLALKMIARFYPYLFYKDPEWENKVFNLLSSWVLRNPDKMLGSPAIAWDTVSSVHDKKFISKNSIAELAKTKEVFPEVHLTESTKLQMYFSFFYEKCTDQFLGCEGLLVFIDHLLAAYEGKIIDKRMIVELIPYLVYTVENLEFPTVDNLNKLYKLILKLCDHFVPIYNVNKNEVSLNSLLALINIFCKKKYQDEEQALKCYTMNTKLLLKKLG